jgi:hypothetical protein
VYAAYEAYCGLPLPGEPGAAAMFVVVVEAALALLVWQGWKLVRWVANPPCRPENVVLPFSVAHQISARLSQTDFISNLELVQTPKIQAAFGQEHRHCKNLHKDSV